MFKWLALILQSIFVGAKIVDKIDWSWWLVFTPTLAYVGLSILWWIIAGIIVYLGIKYDK